MGEKDFIRSVKHTRRRVLMVSLAFVVVLSGVAEGQIVNGSFESGYSGWTLSESVYDPAWGVPFDATGGTWGVGNGGLTLGPGASAFDYFDGITVAQSSPGLPITWGPTDGNAVAFHLQNQSGSQRLYQDFTLAANATHVEWDMQYTNHLIEFDPFGFENFVAVSLRRPGDDALLGQLFRTYPGAEPSIPMTSFSADVTAFAGQQVRLEVGLKNLGYFDLVLDDFRIVPPSDGGGTPPGDDPPPTSLDVALWVRDRINPRSNGVVAVALLGTEGFDPVAEVDRDLLVAGQARPVHGGHAADVNGDGYPDLLVHLNVQDLGLAAAAAARSGSAASGTELCMDGQTLDATPLQACGPVEVVGGGR